MERSTRLVGRLRDAGAVDADDAQARSWRVATGRPAWGSEVAPPHLPEELGLLPTHVHLAKGCYPGQEAVARMWMLGRRAGGSPASR
jgi:tRNA-modifying protein YgfZ